MKHQIQQYGDDHRHKHFVRDLELELHCSSLIVQRFNTVDFENRANRRVLSFHASAGEPRKFVFRAAPAADAAHEGDAVLPFMMSTDAESLYVYRPGYNSSADHTVKAVFLVYGNDGYDVINDYSSSLAPLIVRTLALVNELTSAGR
jgi:hypothetical protein